MILYYIRFTLSFARGLMMTEVNPLAAAEAKKIVDRFVRRFDESYRLLVYHAAIPLILTPELLSYLRRQFLRGQVPWVAEVDLLLSDLFNPVGYELYAMDTAVRAYLLNNIEEFFHELGLDKKHLQEVILILLGYIKYLARTNSFFRTTELQAQQWAGMLCLKDKREQVFQEIKQAWQNCVSEAELARLTQITKELSLQLGNYPSLIQFAESVRDLLLDFKPDLTETNRQTISQISRALEIDLSKFPKLGIEGVRSIGLNQILLVEDELEVIEEISEVLSSQYSIAVTGTDMVSEVIKLAESGEIDLILINRLLPRSVYQGRRVDGFEIVKLLKSNPNISSRLPIVGFSRNYSLGTDKFLESGADGVYSKQELLDTGNYQKFVDYLQEILARVTQTKSSKLGKNYAIAIGINQYRTPYSNPPPAQYAVRDAIVMEEWFCQRGFEHVDLLTDVSPQNLSESDFLATQEAWQGFWEANFSSAPLSAEDTLWFFFSGYGVYQDRQDYLLLADSDLELPERTALSLVELVTRLQSTGAGKVILLLDADRDLLPSQATTRELSSEEVSSLEQQLRAELSPDKGLILFYSSSPQEGAYEIAPLQQGTFTYALRKALTATQGNLSIDRLGKFLGDRVTELNEQYDLPKQTPQSFIFPTQLREWIPFPSSLQVFECKTPTVNRRGEIIKQETKLVQYYTENLPNNITLDLVAIPGGTFMMGSPEGEGYDSERPQHQVTVQPFFMGKFLVTQAQWRAVCEAVPSASASRDELKVNRDLKSNPSRFKGDDNRPVEQVNWYDAVEFCDRLSKLTGRDYRLPSEAEWEYACRAGTTTPFYFGETITDKLANYRASKTYAEEPEGEYRERTTAVGQFLPNAFGLCDMHGNVWEWCADPWHENYEGAPTDGSVWQENGNENCSPLRGGSWILYPLNCRSASRYNIDTRGYRGIDFGFRVLCGFGRTL